MSLTFSNTDSYIPLVTRDVPDAPRALVRRMLTDVLRHFCEQTQFARHEETLTLVDGTSTYTISMPSGQQMSEVLTVRQPAINHEIIPADVDELDKQEPAWETKTASRPDYYVFEDRDQIRFVYTPTGDNLEDVVVRFAVKPTQTGTSAYDAIYNEYGIEIAAGVTARLLRMPRREWTDLVAAGEFAAMYDDAVTRAAIIGSKSWNNRARRRVTGRYH